jgi:hypothetical protein
MPNQANHNPKYLDDSLAEFVDGLLGGKSPAELGMSDEPELRELQQTALTLYQTLQAAQPSTETARSIRRRLTSAQAEAGKDTKNQSIWEWLKKMLGVNQAAWHSAKRRRRAVLVRFAFAAVLVLIVLGPFLTSQDGTLPGAAIDTGWLPLVLLSIAGGGAFVWWLSRRGR